MAIVVYVASLVGIGFFAEYKLQRSAEYLYRYSIMAVSILVLLVTVCLIFASCKQRKLPDDWDE